MIQFDRHGGAYASGILDVLLWWKTWDIFKSWIIQNNTQFYSNTHMQRYLKIAMKREYTFRKRSKAGDLDVVFNKSILLLLDSAIKI